LLVFHTYINEMHGSRSKIPSKNSRPYIYDFKFLALLGVLCVYDISRLRVKLQTPVNYPEESIQNSEHGESLKPGTFKLFEVELLNYFFV
jgi:hypothetical protein